MVARFWQKSKLKLEKTEMVCYYIGCLTVKNEKVKYI